MANNASPLAYARQRGTARTRQTTSGINVRIIIISTSYVVKTMPMCILKKRKKASSSGGEQ